MKFEDIKGQYVLANRLTEIIDSGRIGHAQLFEGKNEDGALAMALAYVQYLNCQNKKHYREGEHHGLRADSCGDCPSCKKIEQLMHTDLHFVFPNAVTPKVKSSSVSSDDFQEEFRDFVLSTKAKGSMGDWFRHLGIENKQGMIRERDADSLTKKLALCSYEGGYKIVLMWMAELMNSTAANKLLKILEEPLDKTLLLLVSERSEGMLATILSRVQRVVVKPETDDSAQSLSLKAQVCTAEERQLFVDWLRMLFKLKMTSLSEHVDKLSTMGRERQKIFLGYALEVMRGCFLNSAAGLPVKLESGDEKFDAAFPRMIGAGNIEMIEQSLEEAMYAIERNANPKITFMKLSFNMSRGLKKA